MSYPVVNEFDARNWYRSWEAACQDAGQRVEPPESPRMEIQALGDDFDWDAECEAIVQRLLGVLQAEGEKAFESKGAVILHKALPDHEALRDPEFWYWMATIPGAALINMRYPFKAQDSKRSGSELGAEQTERTRSFLPGRNNFVGQNAKEVLFFRLWIRAEMSRMLEAAEDPYGFTYRGSVEFWRSHLLRVLYAQHRAFLHAFIDFQFPRSEVPAPRLTIPEIRQLAKDLAKACANFTVEVLDVDECRQFIERVWDRTSADRALVKS